MDLWSIVHLSCRASPDGTRTLPNSVRIVGHCHSRVERESSQRIRPRAVAPLLLNAGEHVIH